jgi:hypothetical protein
MTQVRASDVLSFSNEQKVWSDRTKDDVRNIFFVIMLISLQVHLLMKELSSKLQRVGHEMRMQSEGVTKEALTGYIARRRHRLESPVTFGGQGS